jgi:hypothetical protein
MRVQRHGAGSVRYDKRRGTWSYLWYDGATSRSKRLGTKQQLPTKAAAWKEFDRLKLGERKTHKSGHTLAVRALVTPYREEKMPTRADTRRSYEVWLRKHILPRWGDCVLNEAQARPVEIWLQGLALAPKSKAHTALGWTRLVRRLE